MTHVARNKLRHDWDIIAFALDQFRLSFEAVWPLTLVFQVDLKFSFATVLTAK